MRGRSKARRTGKWGWKQAEEAKRRMCTGKDVKAKGRWIVDGAPKKAKWRAFRTNKINRAVRVTKMRSKMAFLCPTISSLINQHIKEMKRVILSAAIAAAMTFGVALSASAQDVKKEGQQTEQKSCCSKDKDKKHCDKAGKKDCKAADKKSCCKDKKDGKQCNKAKKEEAKKEVQ